MAAGIKTGGRKKGTKNKRTTALKIESYAAGELPLDYLLRTMRTQPSPDMDAKEYLVAATLRFEAAKAAAPFCHPKLAQIEHGNKDGKPFVVQLAGEDGNIL